MNDSFLTLFKYEFKKQFLFKFKKEKTDIVGSLLSIILTLAIIAAFVVFLSVIAKNYILVKVNKVLDSTARAYELLNVFYSILLVAMVFLCLENMRKTLLDNVDKKIMLRLPVKEETLFLSKLIVLMLRNYILAFVLVVPVNVIIYIALSPSAIFWLMTFVVWLFFPLIVSLFTSLLIVPYAKLIEFIKTRYLLVFIMLTIVLALGVLVYMWFLGVVQTYLETGYIRFLFNEEFLTTLQTLLKYTYPANCLAGLALCKDMAKSAIVVLLCSIAAILLVYYVTKNLYHIVLYKNEKLVVVKKKRVTLKKNSVMMGLLKKEFISVSREPKHIFAYLVIATIMPIMVFSCYTLFESLIFNMLGMRLSFSLALFCVLVFSVLTNTFCSTNVTREGTGLLKQKTFPIKATQILTAKVIFCAIVSLLSVLISSIVLILFTSLNIWDGMLCFVVGALFTMAQIFVATRIDLNNLKMSFTFQQIEMRTSTTISKVVLIGLIVSVIAGISALILSALSQGSFILQIASILPVWLVYVVPVVVGLLYCGLSMLFYYYKLQKALDNITK